MARLRVSFRVRFRVRAGAKSGLVLELGLG